MNLLDLFKEKTVLSFEVFPPKTEKGFINFSKEDGLLSHLYDLHPDYISCTYGAGGTNNESNLQALTKIKNDGVCIPVPHFTCVRNTKEDIKDQLLAYLENGIDHILALRGDFPPGKTDTCGDFNYATELVKFIKYEFGDKFTIAVTGSPEGHITCESLEKDIEFLKMKQDLGADYIMTQLCWDLDTFARWQDAISKAGVTMPVDVGILPVLDAKSVVNMSLSRNGCVIEHELSRMISRHWLFPNVFNPCENEDVTAKKKAAFREEGMAYTVRQIEKYISLGVNGIHLYTLNKHDAVTDIIKQAGL